MNARAAVLLTVLLVASPGIATAPEDGDLTTSNPGTSARDAPSSVNTTVIADNTTFPLRSGPGQAVVGRTDLPPGTTLTIRVQSGDPDHPFLRSATATVTQTGRFRSVFDLSEVPPETRLRMVVSHAGSPLVTTNTTVVECSGQCSAPFPAAPSAVLTYSGDTLRLTARPGQAVRGRTNLPPGTDLTVRLVSIDSSAPLIRQTGAIVDDEGRFRAVFGFDDRSTAIDVRVAVTYNGSSLTTARGTLTCSESCADAATPGSRRAYTDAAVGVVQVPNGSVARIRISLGDADTGVLTVESPTTEYTLNLTLRDRTDDGEVIVLFNTSAVPLGEDGIAVADPADEVRVNSERGRFVATDYRLALSPPQNTSVTVATGLLVVTQDVATPLTIAGGEPAPGSSMLSAVALVIGGLLGLLGVGTLLGLIDVRGLLPAE